jgi:vacuolar-type H+-ATPase subunit C/Vma6
MNSDQELSEAEEESHYYSVLNDMVELMSQHGSKQVMMDLLELAMQYETISTSIN